MDKINTINILLVEDNPGDARLVEVMLKQPNEVHYRLHIVGTLAKALEKVINETFQVAILDMNLPDGVGVANITALRSHAIDLPIVVLSGEANEKFALETVKAGAQDYLVKGQIDEWQLSRALNYAIERKHMQDDIMQLAHYDHLTGLANRSLFQVRIEHAIQNASRRNEFIALLYLDLDNFNPINDALGHDIGDQLLIDVAERLKGFVREVDTVARLGGDEFAIILEGIDYKENVAIVAEKITAGLSEPYHIAENSLFITSSIGIAYYPEHGEDILDIIKNADSAMYQAKRSGRNKYVFYENTFNKRNNNEKINLNSELRRAVTDEEFFLQFQPKIDISTCSITGSEALLRWGHPDHGLICPTKFIPLLEQNGMISKVGNWVLKAACEQHMSWQQAGLPVGKIAVNLSGQQLLQKDFSKSVSNILNETGLSPDMLEVELTESILIQNTKSTMSILDMLKEMGVSIAIDDFGTGYSSFNYLRKFLVDTLKIDRSFIKDVTSKSREAAITSAIIKLAQDLGINVIAEGVENREQLDFLKENNIDEIQGYYFSPPVNADKISNMMAAQKNAA
ncbi:MAG: EAL domain-containing protein [Proteobacteria bacterium]|nr:GGDEF domain-containing response regulator [Pseudomonadota bacterium]NOG59709.1 EAL domain-containing protein [Pseudomonadota bacterium]